MKLERGNSHSRLEAQHADASDLVPRRKIYSLKMKTKSLHLILVLSTLGICSCGKNDDNGLALYSHWTNWTQHNTSLSSPISSHGSYLVVLQREAMRLNIKEFDDGNVRTVHSFEMSYPDNHIFYSTPVEFNGEIFLECHQIY